MRKHPKTLPLLENVTVSDAAAEGKALARVDEMVVFIENAVPGDVVDVQLYKKKKSFGEGRAVKFHKFSDKRSIPFCEHFGICGGCKWQHLDYRWQLFYKEKQVKDNFERIAHLKDFNLLPIVGSSETRYYRNKLEYTFSNKRWLTSDEMNIEGIASLKALGFHIPGRFDKILDIKNCYLQPDPSNDIRLAVNEYALKNGLDYYDLKIHQGYLRNLIIRNSSTGELMVIVSVAKDEPEHLHPLLDHMIEKFPQISALLYVINQKKNDTIYDLEIKRYHGKEFMMEEMASPKNSQVKLKFKISPKSFYQTNAKQAEVLYRIAYDFAELKGDEIVYDFYTGTGTIANYIAGSVKKVVGVEYVADAIEDAKINSVLNGFENTSFFSGDLAKIASVDFFNTHGKPDVIITDPPRAGMHEDVIKEIIASEVQRVVYVSCNPATQARDIALMAEHYTVEKVQPVDMFPHTHHVENVVLLRRRN